MPGDQPERLPLAEVHHQGQRELAPVRKAEFGRDTVGALAHRDHGELDAFAAVFEVLRLGEREEHRVEVELDDEVLEEGPADLTRGACPEVDLAGCVLGGDRRLSRELDPRKADRDIRGSARGDRVARPAPADLGRAVVAQAERVDFGAAEEEQLVPEATVVDEHVRLLAVDRAEHPHVAAVHVEGDLDRVPTVEDAVVAGGLSELVGLRRLVRRSAWRAAGREEKGEKTDGETLRGRHRGPPSW